MAQKRECRKCRQYIPYRHTDQNGKLWDLRSRVFCINCSPLGANNRRSDDPSLRPTTGLCSFCGRKFKQYQTRNRKRCSSCNTKIRRYRQKLAAIKYLGGKCEKCGYNTHPAAMEFHHVTGDKEFTIGSAANISWTRLKIELNKCKLFCSNCHRAEHSDRYDNERFLQEVQTYKGRLLD
ncbi:hypothetical protein LCGC14_0871950 [marine sediment metagenome]|uniref:HNH domain-containing protein n=1 Tax=marine sediment metagenome TaxID=412755 RepID=A0A0F9P988_9ZZZZ